VHDTYSHLDTGLRLVPPLVLLWLAFFFGRTLRSGTTPLIERICRQSIPAPSARLCSYTRRLTAIWCAYFIVAAALAALVARSGEHGYGRLGLAVWSGTALLFTGEWLLRKRLFPEVASPSLVQQVRDTWSVWRARDPSARHLH
jgi:uncharacterized membrane protein